MLNQRLELFSFVMCRLSLILAEILITLCWDRLQKRFQGQSAICKSCSTSKCKLVWRKRFGYMKAQSSLAASAVRSKSLKSTFSSSFSYFNDWTFFTMSAPFRPVTLLRWGHSPRVRSRLISLVRGFATVSERARYAD